MNSFRICVSILLSNSRKVWQKMSLDHLYVCAQPEACVCDYRKETVPGVRADR